MRIKFVKEYIKTTNKRQTKMKRVSDREIVFKVKRTNDEK